MSKTRVQEWKNGIDPPTHYSAIVYYTKKKLFYYGKIYVQWNYTNALGFGKICIYGHKRKEWLDFP